ncbi:hypothetical protein WR25_19383 [Diploscapter pachys]|uniref:Uncharacterized protein n=1 Tax=Diploscapter pachys TaxID=2018661 RepID=A0A2A2KF03_9BILA|nr:hypothetical protein WR25_19383 [Diploscapter pachys]
MRSSVSSVPQSKRHFLSFVFACFCFIVSLILTFVGYINNEWITVEKGADKFARGLNDDCYFNGTKPKCKEWSMHDEKIPGYEGWPSPFRQINAPGAAGVWIVILFMSILALYCGTPPLNNITSSDMSLGWGCYMHVFGGITLYILGFAFLFYEEVRVCISNRRSHRPLSTTNQGTEMSARA